MPKLKDDRGRFWARGEGSLPAIANTRKALAEDGSLDGPTVFMVELKRGEVIVDVEKLVAEARRAAYKVAERPTLDDLERAIRSALRRVGER